MILAEVVHADIYFYILINEEEQFNAHKNLPSPSPVPYDGTTTYFNFDVPSITPTWEGGFAGGNPVGQAHLKVTIDLFDYTLSC